MVANKIFAIIVDGVIRNLCVGDYEKTNFIAKASYGEAAFAKEVTQYPVQEGDTYKEGSFYRIDETTKGETEILAVPTNEDEVAKLSRDTEQNAADIAYISMLYNVELGV